MTSQKLKMGLDCDGVLIHHREELFFECLRQAGYKADYSVFAATHSWRQATNATRAEVDAQFARFIVLGADEQMLVPGASNALQRLSSHCSFHLVTSRPFELRDATLRLLNSHLGSCFRSTTFGKPTRKGHAVCEGRMKIFVDDSKTELEHILQHSPDTICIQFPSFRQAVQEAIDHERVVRLAACDDVESGIHDMQTRQALWENAWLEVATVTMEHVSAKATVA